MCVECDSWVHQDFAVQCLQADGTIAAGGNVAGHFRLDAACCQPNTAGFRRDSESRLKIAGRGEIDAADACCLDASVDLDPARSGGDQNVTGATQGLEAAFVDPQKIRGTHIDTTGAGRRLQAEDLHVQILLRIRAADVGAGTQSQQAVRRQIQSFLDGIVDNAADCPAIAGFDRDVTGKAEDLSQHHIAGGTQRNLTLLTADHGAFSHLDAAGKGALLTDPGDQADESVATCDDAGRSFLENVLPGCQGHVAVGQVFDAADHGNHTTGTEADGGCGIHVTRIADPQSLKFSHLSHKDVFQSLQVDVTGGSQSGQCQVRTVDFDGAGGRSDTCDCLNRDLMSPQISVGIIIKLSHRRTGLDSDLTTGNRIADEDEALTATEQDDVADFCDGLLHLQITVNCAESETSGPCESRHDIRRRFTFDDDAAAAGRQAGVSRGEGVFQENSVRHTVSVDRGSPDSQRCRIADAGQGAQAELRCGQFGAAVDRTTCGRDCDGSPGPHCSMQLGIAHPVTGSQQHHTGYPGNSGFHEGGAGGEQAAGAIGTGDDLQRCGSGNGPGDHEVVSGRERDSVRINDSENSHAATRRQTDAAGS